MSKRTQLYYQRYPALWYDNRTSNTAALLSPTVEFALPGSWTLSLGGTWSRDENDYEIWTVMAGSGDTSLARRACNCNGSRSYEVSGEGPLFSMSGGDARLAVRSEEHTSELQSLMRNSYAVFCLKKKRNK